VYQLNKKGFAISFNWIFSLVAGVIIFSFLIFFAVQNTDLFGRLTAKVVAEEFDILLSGYETGETESELNFGKEINLQFLCKDKRQNFIVNGREGKGVRGKIIFSPKEIKSNKVNIATRSWDIPFRAANFVYIWDNKYDIQEKVETGSSLVDAIKGKGERIVIDQFFGGSGCPNSGDKTIYYDDESGDGYVCFKDGLRVDFFGEAMMLGAIFNDDKETFECISNIAQDRIKIMHEVYGNKINNLGGSGAFCNPTIYNYQNYNYQNFLSKLKGVSSLPLLTSSNVDFVDTINDNLAKEGCASVY
jgi:hypothetical protein